MVTFSRLLAVAALAVAAFGAFATSASAQTYPVRPIRFVLGLPPGGNTDINARLFGTHMSKSLGQSIIIDNRPGAGGTIAANAVVQAEPDGYNLYFGAISAISPIFSKSNAVDAPKQLAPVSLLFSTAYYFIVRSSLPIHNFAELVAYAKSNPGKLNLASPAPTVDLIMETLKQRTGATYVSIPFKGQQPAVTAMLAEQVDMTVDSLPAYLPYVQTGKVRVLFATKASPLLPNLPTVADVGLRNFEAAGNNGIWAPKGVPSDIIRKLNTAAVGAVKLPEVAENLRQNSDAIPVGSTPEEQMRVAETDLAFWTEAARLAHYEPQ